MREVFTNEGCGTLIVAGEGVRTLLLLGDAELVDEVPLDPWDLPVDVVVTPSATVATGARGVPWPPAAE